LYSENRPDGDVIRYQNMQLYDNRTIFVFDRVLKLPQYGSLSLDLVSKPVPSISYAYIRLCNVVIVKVVWTQLTGYFSCQSTVRSADLPSGNAY